MCVCVFILFLFIPSPLWDSYLGYDYYARISRARERDLKWLVMIIIGPTHGSRYIVLRDYGPLADNIL